MVRIGLLLMQAMARLSLIDEQACSIVQRGGVPLDLSPREFQLLLELAREPGAVVPKGVLAQRLDPLGEPLLFS